MNFRLVMIGPHGERDYVEKLLDLDVPGYPRMPILGGSSNEFAEVFPETCAKRIAADIRKYWLSPHVAVELEPA